MRFANEWDMERYVEEALDAHAPNRLAAARTLVRLATWTNENSDGWAYWPKPVRAAAKLIEALDTVGTRRDSFDFERAHLTKLYTPIKAFLTRQGVEHSTIIVNPEA